MFLEVWLREVGRWSPWLGIMGYVFWGIVIGFQGWQWRRVLFFVASFSVVFTVAMAIVWGNWHMKGGFPVFSAEALRSVWSVVALGVALLIAVWPRREAVGRFLLGFWLLLNLHFLLLRWVEEVELLRFLVQIPGGVWFGGAVIAGIGALHRTVLQLVSACLGSVLLNIAYLTALRYAGYQDSFFAHSSFALFVFFLVAVWMYAGQGE